MMMLRRIVLRLLLMLMELASFSSLHVIPPFMLRDIHSGG
jgi:hypothetical protein